MPKTLKTWQIVAICAVLSLLLTNPTVRDFKEYLGKTSYSGLSRKNNFLICSVYCYNTRYYLGFLSNIIDITTENKKVDVAAVNEAVHVDTAARAVVDTNGYSITPEALQRLPYRDRIYLAMCDVDPNFKITKEEYDIKIQDYKYVNSLYDFMVANLGKLAKNRIEFCNSVHVSSIEKGGKGYFPLPPTNEDWSKYEVKP